MFESNTAKIENTLISKKLEVEENSNHLPETSRCFGQINCLLVRINHADLNTFLKIGMIRFNGSDGLKVIYIESTRAVKELEPMKSF